MQTVHTCENIEEFTRPIYVLFMVIELPNLGQCFDLSFMFEGYLVTFTCYQTIKLFIWKKRKEYDWSSLLFKLAVKLHNHFQHTNFTCSNGTNIKYFWGTDFVFKLHVHQYGPGMVRMHSCQQVWLYSHFLMLLNAAQIVGVICRDRWPLRVDIAPLGRKGPMDARNVYGMAFN